MESALPGRKLPISRPAPHFEKHRSGQSGWQGPRVRRPPSPAVLPQNSSRFSRVKAFQFVVCFQSIYSALKWLFWAIFPVLCSFHRKEPPVPTPLFPEVSSHQLLSECSHEDLGTASMGAPRLPHVPLHLPRSAPKLLQRGPCPSEPSAGNFSSHIFQPCLGEGRTLSLEFLLSYARVIQP